MAFDTAQIRADNPLSSVIGKSIPLKRDGAEYRACCPFHKEKTASFTVSDEKGFYHCFGCGAHGDVIRWVADFYGVEFTEACEILGGKKEAPQRAHLPASDQKEKKDDDAYAGLIPLYPLPEIKPNESVRYWNPKRNHFVSSVPTMVFPYRNFEGQVRGYVIRIEIDGNKLTPQIRWIKKQDGTECFSMMPFDKPRPLYGLEKLATAQGQVLLVEGEKCADAAQRLLGITTLSWCGGANGLAQVDWRPLAGRRVVLWCDADEPGQQAMDGGLKKGNSAFKYSPGAADYLHDIKVAEVKIVPWDKDKPKGWDVADAEKEGMTKAQVLEWFKNTVKLRPARPPEPDVPLVEPPKLADILPSNAAEDMSVSHKEDDSGEKNVFSDAPFRCLGFDRDHYYYLSNETQIISCLSASQHTKQHLVKLASMAYWEKAFYTKNPGFDVDAAFNAMMRTCAAKGFFNVNNIRGRGAWWDGENVAIHLGDQVLMGDKSYKPSKVPSRYVYEQGFPLKADLDNPLDTKEANKFVKLMEMMPFEKPISALYVAGWCVIAHIGGALHWRPHLWITGAKESGKTHVVSDVVAPIMGENLLFVQSSSSEAGIRQSLGADSLPVLFDEAEGENQASVLRLQRVLELIRASSSSKGAIIAKGTQKGEAMRFEIRSCFCLSSINASLIQQSDKSRMTVVELSKAMHKHPIDVLREIEAKLLTPEYISRFHARALRLSPIIRKNAITFAKAVADVFKNQRSGDQIGAFLAGAYSLHSDKQLTYEKAVEWVNKQDWTEQKDEARGQSDESAIMDHLASCRIPVKLNHGTDNITLGELIETANGKYNEELSTSKANTVIMRYGLKVEHGWLYISNTSSAVKAMLKDTPWSTEWSRIIRRINGAESAQGVVYFGFNRGGTRAIRIPLEEQPPFELDEPH